MPALAAPLLLIAICELLGVPEGDRPDFTMWAAPGTLAYRKSVLMHAPETLPVCLT
jgi:cytochrome P450